MLIWEILKNFIKENPTVDLSILKRERDRAVNVILQTLRTVGHV
jgi:hypothetical protein